MKIYYVSSPVKLFLLLFILQALLFFVGCASVGPDYIPPHANISAQWNTALQEKSVPTDLIQNDIMAKWWNMLNDPDLSNLIERALDGNPDLKIAIARIRQVRASRGIARANYFPAIDASGSGTRSFDSAIKGSDKMNGLYKAGFDSTWELDMFGGLRRSVEAATADVQAAEENHRDVLVSLLGEVSINYIEVRIYQTRIIKTEGNIAKQKETYQVTLWRKQAGLGDELEVQEACYNLENTKAQLPGLRSGMEQALNRIAVLLGENPGSIHEQLSKPSNVPVSPSYIAVGIPSETLRRRPDVRRAERELAAQTARVGVAIAELYPKLILSGSIGIESLSLNNFISVPSRMYSFGPGVSLPIFRGNAIRKNIEVQSALQEQALIQYEKTVLNALEEVENILVAYLEEQKKRDSLRNAEEAGSMAMRIAFKKYETGLTDFLVVLDAQRSLLSLQDQLVQSDGAVISNMVKLYKALGGGWDSTLAENQTKN